MFVLALDTSSESTCCALVELLPGAARTLAEERIGPPVKAGDVLPEALVSLCERAGRTLEEIAGFAVGLGPGSFTGLRVGLACVKGLAYARQVPLAGASSLHALALAALRTLNLQEGVLVPALEARRGELFLSAYSIQPGALISLAIEQVLQARDVLAWLSQLGKIAGHDLSSSSPGSHAGELSESISAPLLVGPGAARNLDLLRQRGVPDASLRLASEPLFPSAAALAGLCASTLLASKFDPQSLFALAPLYLAQSEPEKALAAGRVGKLPSTSE